MARLSHCLRFFQPAFGEQQTSEFAQGKSRDSIGCPGFVDRLTKIVFSLFIIVRLRTPACRNSIDLETEGSRHRKSEREEESESALHR